MIFILCIADLYKAIFCGIRWLGNQNKEIKPRGIDKKEYMERRRQENQKKNKEELEAND
ncbi:hypothetical protein SDC9_155780 [bioreactor metagenome]|uniref:Uncharacterized protein n=1 Tax=bioreactor metagenome TaxID=1076179 RepID=A0A645F2F6_9ZZZZ